MARKNWLTILKYGLVALLAASLVWFCARVDPEELLSALSKIGWGYGWIMVSTFFAYLLGTISWRYCMSDELSHVSIMRLFVIRLIGENVTLIQPSNLIGGESMKAYLLEKEGSSYAEAFSSIILARAILIFTQIILFVFAACFFMLMAESVNKQLVWIIVASVSTVVILAVAILNLKNTSLIKKWVLKSEFAQKLSSGISKTSVLMKDRYRNHKKKLLLSAIFGSLHWFVGSLELYLLFNFLGYEVGLIDALLMDMGIILLKSFGAFVPGQIGVEEYANKALFEVVGISDYTIWITVSLLRRFRQLIWIGIGLVMYYFYKKRIDNIINIDRTHSGAVQVE